MSEEPSAIGPYVVVASLPPDESGALYLVREDGKSGLDELRTLLLLSPALAADASFRSRFVDHAQRCAKAQGNVVLAPIHVGEHDGRPYVVHRYVHGVTLRQLLAGLHTNGRRLTPEVACAIALHVATALDSVHDTPDAQGQPLELVHGAINADRLLIGFDGRICLTGFGIARDLSRPPPPGDARIADTRRYAAPEVLLGEDPDTRADVHSIGVLLWEAITNRRLDPSAKSAGVAPSTFASDCPSALDLVVQQCLSENPDRRPLTLDELSHMLTLGVQVANRVKLDDVCCVASVVVTPELERGRIKLPADVTKLFDRARPPLDPTALDALTQPLSAGTPRDFMDDLTKWARPAGAPPMAAPPVRSQKERASKPPTAAGAFIRPEEVVVAEEIPLIVETTNVRISVPPPVPPPRISVPPPVPPNVAAKAAAFAKDESAAKPPLGAKPAIAPKPAAPKPAAPKPAAPRAPLAPSSTSATAKAVGVAPPAKAPLPAAKPPLSSGTTSAGARALPAVKAPLPAAKAPLSSGTTSAGARALPAAKVPSPVRAPIASRPGAPAPKKTIMGVGLPEAEAAQPMQPVQPAEAAPETKPAVQVAPTLAAGSIVEKPASVPPPSASPTEVAPAVVVPTEVAPATAAPVSVRPPSPAPASLPPPPPRPPSMPPPPPGMPESPFGMAPSSNDPFGLGAVPKPAATPLAVDADWGNDESLGAAPLDAATLDARAKAPTPATILGAAQPSRVPPVTDALDAAQPESSPGRSRMLPMVLGLLFVLMAGAAAYFFVFRGGEPTAPIAADQDVTAVGADTQAGAGPVVAAAAVDAGTATAAPVVDAGEDLGVDAGEDLGVDAGDDAGFDAGIDAGEAELAAAESEDSSSSRSSSSRRSSSSMRTASTSSSTATPTPAPTPTPMTTTTQMTTAPAMVAEEDLSFRERRALRRAQRRGD